jgi:hypothetical protein
MAESGLLPHGWSGPSTVHSTPAPSSDAAWTGSNRICVRQVWPVLSVASTPCRASGFASSFLRSTAPLCFWSGRSAPLTVATPSSVAGMVVG